MHVARIAVNKNIVKPRFFFFFKSQNKLRKWIFKTLFFFPDLMIAQDRTGPMKMRTRPTSLHQNGLLRARSTESSQTRTGRKSRGSQSSHLRQLFGDLGVRWLKSRQPSLSLWAWQTRIGSCLLSTASQSETFPQSTPLSSKQACFWH